MHVTKAISSAAVLTLVVLSWSLLPSSGAATETKSGPDLFAPDHLLQIEVKMDPKDWHELRIGHRVQNEKVKLRDRPYEYYRADVIIDGTQVRSVSVRKKGFLGSVVSTRPSLKINFDEYVKGQTFRGLDLMTLNNNNQDVTQANQVLATRFSTGPGSWLRAAVWPTWW